MKNQSVKSMTGFGSATVISGKNRFVVDVRSVNNRFLKVFVKSSGRQANLEEKIKEIVGKQLTRGSIEVFVNVQKPEAVNYPLPDKNILTHMLREWKGIQRSLKLPGDIALSHLIHLPFVYKKPEEDDESKDWPMIEKALVKSLNNLLLMRDKEGKSTATELLKYNKFIETVLKKIEKVAPKVVERYANRLKTRIESALSKEPFERYLESGEFAREVSNFADRSDIAEEISRLKSHMAQFVEVIGAGGQVGKKLDFIAQEMYREINTLGSKAQDAGISGCVIEVKDVLEKIREQVQNLE